MRQGYLGFRWEDLPVDDLGGPCFEASALALPLPSFFPFKDFSATVDWKTWTSEVLPGPGGFWDKLLGIAFEINFCLEEDLVGVWDTELITPSMGGTVGDFDATGLDDGCRALGNNSYKVPD